MSDQDQLYPPLQHHGDVEPSQPISPIVPEPAPGENPSYPALFSSHSTYQPPTRTPNFADLLLFGLMLLVGLLVMLGSMAGAAVIGRKFFGLPDLDHLKSSTSLALVSEVILYGVTLACSIPIFRMAWNKPFFTGIHWHWTTARRLYPRLAGVAVLCNLVAMLGNAILPFPQHAPIDKMFSTTRDAWLLLIFGTTIAPFFEELIFRGFLLPAIATAWDWAVERLTHRLPRPLDREDNPVWSPGAQIFSALIVSAPFALMHAEQVGNSWGPVLLLYCVSLILSAVRLRTRSLASSTLVHATYNFLLFAIMFYETDAFRHLDKM